MKISIIKKINKFFIYVMIFSIISVFINMMISYVLTSKYNQIVKNIEHTKKLVSIVESDIPNETWQIVCGMIQFEDGKQGEMIEEIEYGISYLNNHSIGKKKIELELAQRTTNTLNSYIQELKLQISEGAKVDDLVATNEEIKSVAFVVSEMLEEYNDAETASVAMLNRNISIAQKLLLVFNILIIGVFIFLMMKNRSNLTAAIQNPLFSLESMSGRIADGDFNARAEDTEVYELESLTNSLNFMASKIEELIAENNRKHENLKKAEMNLLQAQIKPHFLYNTYDTIIWLAEKNKMDDVVKVVQALTTFYRTSLNKGKDWVAVEDEIKHVESYLVIQKFRYGNILQYSIKYDEDIKRLYILKLLIQPLVENSIYHGIKYLREPGKIDINVNREGDYIKAEIMDNGVGISTNELKKILEGMKDDKAHINDDASFGMLNVYHRIKLYYGKDSDMVIESNEGQGTKIILKLDINADKNGRIGDGADV